MGRRTLLVVLAALVAVGAGIGAGVISAARHRSGSPATHDSVAGPSVQPVLHFTSRTTKSTYLDNTRKGLSAGDVLTQHSAWYRAGKEAGSMALTATVTRRTGAETGEVMFTAVAHVDDGQIVMAGVFSLVPQNQTFAAAVTGGTGAFHDARGQAVFQQTSGSTTLVTLALR